MIHRLVQLVSELFDVPISRTSEWRLLGMKYAEKKEVGRIAENSEKQPEVKP